VCIKPTPDIPKHFMSASPDTIGKGIMLSVCLSTVLVRSFIWTELITTMSYVKQSQPLPMTSLDSEDERTRSLQAVKVKSCEHRMS